MPTQIDRFILLKSLPFSALTPKQDAYNTLSTLKVNIKLSHFHENIMVTRLNETSRKLKPGDVLLSHGEAPHYHRRYCVSLLSSAWSQVGPQRYGRQANSLIRKAEFVLHIQCSFIEPTKPLRCCMVKPHGQLVLVSSTPRSAYTPNLSTF